MGCLGNLLWFMLGGGLSGLSWCLAGFLWCLTVIGIPGGGTGSFLLNLVWLMVSGLPLALEHIGLGLILTLTIVGIPFGLQQFKLAKLAFMPFGTEIY